MVLQTWFFPEAMLYDSLPFANPHQLITVKILHTRVGSTQGLRLDCMGTPRLTCWKELNSVGAIPRA